MAETSSHVSVLTLHWRRSAADRIVRFWPIKFAGSVLFAVFFFAGYFALLHHPFFPVTVMPTMAPDRWIVFCPRSIWLYGSLWLYLQLAPALLRTKREMWSYGVALGAMSAFAFTIFFFFPTTVPPFDVAWLNYAGFTALKKADAAGNACPSLHVAFAVFTALWSSRLLRDLQAPTVWRLVNWLWALGIVYSTLSTRQHVFIDVVAGTALGVATVLAHFYWLGRGPAPEVSIAN